MASGKSSVGRELAKKTGKFMLDTDFILEGFNGLNTREFRDKFGSHNLENSQSKMFKFLKFSVTNSIIATGGNLYKFPLKELGVCFYLECEFDELLRCHENNKVSKRGVFIDPLKAKNLYNKTAKNFKVESHYSIKTDGKTPSQISDEILLKVPHSFS